MTEFKILDNGIELYYSNYQILNEEEFQVVVRAERWNSDMARYEGLDVILPSGEIDNIEYLKSNQIEEFKEVVFQNQEEIVKSARRDSYIDEGDNLIEFSSIDSEKEVKDNKDSVEKDNKLLMVDEEEMKLFNYEFEKEEKEEKPSFFKRILSKLF